jgi:hypothetical protein
MAADILRVALAAAAQPVALVAVTLLEVLGVDVPRVALVAAEASAAAVAVDSMVAAVVDSMAAVVAADSTVAAVAPTVAADIANRKREVNKPVCFGRRAFFFSPTLEFVPSSGLLARRPRQPAKPIGNALRRRRMRLRASCCRHRRKALRVFEQFHQRPKQPAWLIQFPLLKHYRRPGGNHGFSVRTLVLVCCCRKRYE